jgi:hypothetical protein
MVNCPAIDIALRTAAAGLGGFALANAASALGAATLPLNRAEAVTWMTIAAFPIHLGSVLWAFAARTVLSAWLGIAGPALLCLSFLQ